MARAWIIITALLGAAAVTVGAYHAHGLEKALGKRGLDSVEIAKQMHNCDTAVKYQMYHALAILGIGLMVARRCTWSGSLAAALMLLGVIGFSGGLYADVFDIVRLSRLVVPIGGLLMILGWLALGVAGLFVVVESCDAKK